MSSINPGGIIANPDLFTIIDVRTKEEWNSFHLENSIHIPLDEIEGRFGEIKTKKPIVCICRSGSRSFTAMYFLRENGFDARNIEGGLIAYLRTLLQKKLITETEYKDKLKKIE